jgi:Domain of unknown function (DUF2828)
MPEMLLILSDMQFNMAVGSYNKSAQQMIRAEFESEGYEMPKIVFWNLSPYGNDNKPVRFDDLGVCHISGFSPAIMKAILSNKLEAFTPMNVMLEALMNPRYDL